MNQLQQIILKKMLLDSISSYSSKSSITSRRLIGIGEDCNQFCPQIRALAIFGVRELRNGSSTRPPVLKANSKATVETGTALLFEREFDTCGY